MGGSVDRAPTPQPEDGGDHRPALWETINTKLIGSGEKERLEELLREGLVECGWIDGMRGLCREFTRKRRRTNVNVDDLIHDITPKGRASVPYLVKAELLQHIRSFVESTSRRFISQSCRLLLCLQAASIPDSVKAEPLPSSDAFSP